MIMAFNNRSPWIVVTFIAFAFHVSLCELSIVEHGSHIECYNIPENGCSGIPDLTISSPRECCLGDGYWYRLDPSGECMQCIVHGFQQTAFVSEEGVILRIPILLNQKGNQSFSRRHRMSVQVIPQSADSSDYHLRTGSFRFNNELLYNVEVSLVSDDVALEGNETFQLELEMHPELEDNEFLRNMCSITITDKTRTIFAFFEADYGFEEGYSNTNIQIRRSDSNLLASHLVLHVTPLTFEEARERGISLPTELPASATRQDFSNSPPVEIVLSGSARGILSAPIPISDDEINELEEGFIVVLEVASAVDPALVDLSGRNTALFRIRDNDDISIGFERGEYSFNESDADFFDTVTLIKDRQSEQMFIVTVVVQLQLRKSYRDATAGKDFSIGTVDHRINLRFGPEVNRRTVVLEIFDDAIPEGTEAFQIFSFRKITGNNPYFDCKVAEGCLASTLVKIIDDEVLTVGFEATEVTVLESDGAVMLCVNITEPGNEEIEIEFKLEAILYSGTTGDFVLLNTSLEQFSESLRRQCFNVNIEGTEMFTVTLRTPVGEFTPQVQIIPASATIQIMDSTYVIGIEHEAYSVSEGDGSLKLCAILVRGIPTELAKFTLTTVDGGAAASKDYTSIAENLVLSSVTTRACVDIPILDDVVPEFAEDFTVRLTINDDRANTAIKVATVTISDDDEPEEGCSVEVLVLTATQERNQKAVVEDVVTVFPSVLAGSRDSEPTSAEELFASVYSSLAKDFGRVESDTGYTQFKEAVTEITEARQEACDGPPDERPTREDVPGLAQRFARLPLSEANELRKIFGKMLCITTSAESLARKKRDDHCTCPDRGFDDPSLTECQFFDCLDDDIEERYGERLEAVFNFDVEDFQCLGFVVDTTGSMGQEIAAVRDLILSFISSEQDEPACYVITPFNDYGSPPILGRDYGPARVYDTSLVTDLSRMRNDILALEAVGGGDCEEYGMHGLKETLNSRDADGFDTMIEGSQMILITDAFEKDTSRVNNIIEQARLRKVCIHAFLSESGCGGDFSNYIRVATETGGRVVRGTSDQFDELIGVFGEFSTAYQTSPCSAFHSRRKKRQTFTAGRCHTFRVSTFTDILKFLISTDQSQATVRKPSGETVSISVTAGYGSYREVGPEPGEWSVCVATGTFTIQFNNRVLLDFVVTFVKEDESSPGHLTATSVPPPACSIGEVAVVTSQIPDISSARLNFIRDGSVAASAALTLCGGAMVGNATFPLGSVTYQIQGEDKGRNSFEISRKTVEFKPGKYLLTALSDSVELVRGERSVFTFGLKNQNSDGSTNFTFTTESTSGVRAVPQQTSTLLKAGESTEISVPISAGSILGAQQVTLTASDGCTRATASQSLSITAPELPTAAPDACGCERGICVSRTRRGRVINTCRCPPGYGGRRCEIAL